MFERKIEKYLVQEVNRRGGTALKFVSPWCDGVPDQLILFPGGKIAFIEVKAPGKKTKTSADEKSEGFCGAWTKGICSG